MEQKLQGNGEIGVGHFHNLKESSQKAFLFEKENILKLQKFTHIILHRLSEIII